MGFNQVFGQSFHLDLSESVLLEHELKVLPDARVNLEETSRRKERTILALERFVPVVALPVVLDHFEKGEAPKRHVSFLSERPQELPQAAWGENNPPFQEKRPQSESKPRRGAPHGALQVLELHDIHGLSLVLLPH